ncbi:MAG: hypothetical protein KF715_02870 [Candidatus Didemnitutus sp.]|nr:hypothetical protein [Candidatus Didemnitutus sp.]
MVVFLDTNVFLHYRRFTEIDWLAVAGERQVTITFPPITLRELNEKKDGGASQKIKRRAQAALMDIERLFRSELRATIREGVFGECITSEPQIDFAAHQLRTDIQDDWLIASVLEQKRRDGTQHYVLVTADLGLKLKCRAHKIEVLQLSDDLKLPEEEDSEAKRIRLLEAEVLALKSTIPELSLSFVDGTSLLRLSFKEEMPFDERNAIELLEEAKRTHKKLRVREESSAEPETVSMQVAKFLEQLHGYHPEDAKRYNEDLEEYWGCFIENRKKQHAYENYLRRSYPIKIGVSNDGTAPADDIVVHMHFPDGFFLCEKNEFPEAPDLPAPPDLPLKPSEKWQNLSLPVAYPSNLAALRDAPVVARMDAKRSLRIRKTNSFDVDFKVRKLNHGFTEELNEMILTLNAPATRTSFQVDYEIHAANLPKPRRGSLHIVIE